MGLMSIIIIAMKSNVMRIVVVGDAGVGKTSLVCAIISDLTSEVPKIHKKVVLPPDMCAYSKDIFT
jgi:GTPase SAR1 family protein